MDHRRRLTQRAMSALFVLGLLLAAGGAHSLCAGAALGAPKVKVLEDAQGKLQGWSDGVSTVPDGATGNRALRWVPEAGTSAQSINFDFRGRGVEMSDWDRLLFDYRFEQEGCAWWGVKVVDFPLADGMQATWQITDPEATRPGTWRTAVINLHQPTWLWGDKPDRTSQIVMFRCQMGQGQTTPILIRNIRVERDPLRLAKVERGTPARADGRLSVSYRITLDNADTAPARLSVGVRDVSPGLSVQGVPQEVVLAAGELRAMTVQLSVPLTGPNAPAPLATLNAQFYARRSTMEKDEKATVMSLAVPLAELPHPFALLTRQDVPRIRERMARSPEARAVYEDLKRRADDWLAKTPQYPDRGSQWWHWYTCKACGGRLETKSPTQHVCPDCGKVYTGWPYDDVVLDRQHGALAGAIRDLGLMYVLDGNRAYAAKAKEILMGYAERYLKYPLHDINGKPNKGGGHVGPQTLDESTWLIPVVQGFDCIYDTLSADEVKRLADQMLLPAARLIHDHQWGIHNICCWHDSAYGLVGLALGDEQLASDSINGPKGFRAQVEKGVSEDGFWYEGAWGYHYYTMSALEPLAIAAHHIGIDLYSERYKRMYDAPLRFMAPGGMLPAFHDSGTTNALGGGNLYEVAYARWKDPVFLLPLRRAGRKSLEALLYGVELGDAPKFALGSTIFPAAGWAILRSGAAGSGDADQHIPRNYLALDFGPHGGGHGHPDKLSFVLYGRGALLAEDPGAIAYGNPAHQGWYRQTLGHNTVLVDGKSQQPCTGTVQVSAFAPDAGLFSARADGAYPGVRLRRTVALIGDRLIDLFLCESGAAHTYDWSYHNRGVFQTALPLPPMSPAPKGDGFDWAKEWRQATARKAWSGTWRQEGGEGLVLAQADPDGPQQVLAGIGLGNPPSIKPPFVVARRQGKSALFASAMEWFAGAQAPALAVRLLPIEGAVSTGERPTAVEVTGGEVRDVLLINPAGGSVRAGEFELQGKGALLRLRGERVEKVVLAEGARVLRNGTELRPAR